MGYVSFRAADGPLASAVASLVATDRRTTQLAVAGVSQPSAGLAPMPDNRSAQRFTSNMFLQAFASNLELRANLCFQPTPRPKV